jgi:hypothetical protein
MTRLHVVNLLFRWTARLSAAFLLGMVVLIVFGEVVFGGGGPNFAKMDWCQRSMFIAEFVTFLGLIMIWRRELLGGLLIIGGMVFFYSMNYHLSGKLPGGAFPLFYIPGLLAVTSAGIKRLISVAVTLE